MLVKSMNSAWSPCTADPIPKPDIALPLSSLPVPVRSSPPLSNRHSALFASRPLL
jgi:hypothetical protein